ncbi:MAG: hypothetical protein ACYC5Q_04715 [Thermoleophilia bacterium]
MFLHSRWLLSVAYEARDRVATAVANNPNVWPGEATVAVVMAAVSTEAFINELAALLKMHRDSSHPGMAVPLQACADALEEIENSRGSLSLKYLMAYTTLAGAPVDKGANPYQDFATLLRLRNDLVHLKPRDTLDTQPGGGHRVRWPRYIEELEKRGLARRRQDGVSTSWFSALQTEEMARWACASALNVMLGVLDLIQDGSFDPVEGLKWTFRKVREKEGGRGAA